MHSISGGLKRCRAAIFCALVLLFSICFVFKTSALTYQSDVNVNFTFNPVISLTVGGDLLINNLTPGNSSDSNIIDVSVTTNASYGYVLSATVGQKNGTDSLVNTSNNTYTFTNLSTTAGSAATLNNFTDNKWGYSYSVDNGTNWISGSVGSTASGYAGLPLDNNNNAEDRGLGGVTLIDTSNPADNKTIKFKIGAKAANTQAAGTYTNTINFYAVANAIPMSIPDAFAAANKTKFNGYYKMQDMTSAICSSVELEDENSQTQLIDTRDNKVYRVAKLADSHCWMLDNLALDLTDSSVQANLSSSTTNASDVFLNHLKNGGGTAADKYPTSSVTKTWTSGNSFSTPMIAVDSATSGVCTNADCVNDPTSGHWSSASITQATINGTTSIAQGKIGVYYNYCAASAGSYCWGNGASSSGSPSSDPIANSLRDIEADICPIGWRLPTGSDSGEFKGLLTAYNNNSERFQTAFSTPLAGHFVSGHAGNQGYRGTIYSSTWNSDTSVFYVHITPNSVSVSSAGSRFYGHSVRCILDY